MAKKGSKQTKKFVQSGALKRTIDTRRKQQKFKKQIQARKGVRGAPAATPRGHDDEEGDEGEDGGRSKKGKGKGRAKAVDFLEEDEDAEEEGGDAVASKGKLGGMSVDDLLNGNFMDEDEDEGPASGAESEDFSDVDDLEGDEEAHKLELAALAKKDPEFYKYLQENDNELLNFTVPAGTAAEDGDGDSEDGGFETGDVEMDDGSEDEDGEEEIPVLTKEILRGWQKAIIETRSLRALRKLLLAFRTASRLNDEDTSSSPGRWRIEEASVFNKLVVTTLKYTPVVLEHHIPYKSLPGGKFKPPTQTAKSRGLSKLLQSHFLNLTKFIESLSDPAMQELALKESAKLIPWVWEGRKGVRGYLKMCFELWATAADEVRLAALIAMRVMMGSGDESIVDLVLRGSYLTLLRSSKSTTAHTLPSITLMKNSAAELYAVDPASSYQHAFGFIRQLAVHLRNSMKVKSKEAYKQVYNWQFVHSVDFWSMVLAKTCDVGAESDGGGESELKPLIYPLIQVTLGAVKLIPTARYYPLHLQLLRSLLHIIQRTSTYLSLAPFLLPIIVSSLSSPSSSKSSKANLRPLDMTLHIRAPAQYLKTRSYGESIVDEALFVLGSWAESCAGSIAFPETVFPVLLALRKSLKKASSGKSGKANTKLISQTKTLLERIEESVKWTTSRRDAVSFAPVHTDEIERWERDVREKVGDTPIGKYMRVLRKAREKRLALLEKAREGGHETLDSD